MARLRDDPRRLAELYDRLQARFDSLIREIEQAGNVLDKGQTELVGKLRERLSKVGEALAKSAGAVPPGSVPVKALLPLPKTPLPGGSGGLGSPSLPGETPEEWGKGWGPWPGSWDTAAGGAGKGGGTHPPPPSLPPPHTPGGGGGRDKEGGQSWWQKLVGHRQAGLVGREATSTSFGFVDDLVDRMNTLHRARMGEPGARASALAGAVGDIGRGANVMGEHPRLGQALGGVINTAGNVAAFAGPWGEAAAGVLKLGAAAVESVDKIRDWARALHDSNMQFAQFSGAMAGVKARQEVREIQFSQERGDARADTAERLAESMMRLENTIAPFEDLFANVLNVGMSELLNQLNTLIQILQLTHPWLAALVQQRDRPERGVDIGNSLTRAANEQWFRTYGMGQRFGQIPQNSP